LRKPVIDPVGEACNDLFIIASLAERLGFGSLFPHNNEELLERTFVTNRGFLENFSESRRLNSPALPRATIS
ncbi:MAG: hypothetical protein PHU36_09300, partial [Syntrophomonadaceae bacterium]|nr:hypothetical protein [Syntrophomonadaceae bacterium]